MMMITLAKLIMGNFLIILIASNLSTVNNPGSIEYGTVKKYENPAKLQAFEILTNKCNVCHEKRNKRGVFTPENMDARADDVYKQVFIKKRMPKGKNIKLTSNEY